MIKKIALVTCLLAAQTSLAFIYNTPYTSEQASHANMNAIFLEDVLKRQRETTEDVQKLDDRMQMAETNAETAKNNVQFFLKTRMLKDLGIVFFSTLFGYLINKATQN